MLGWSGRRSLRAALSLALTHAPLASRLPLVSYFYYPLGFIFMYLLFCISLPLFLKVAFPPFLEGSDTISTAENSGYVSLCIIHYSVDPEGCRISNKCCLCVLPSFRRPMFANSHTPIVLYASLYPLPLSLVVILTRRDVVIASRYCQKFSVFFTTSYDTRISSLFLLLSLCLIGIFLIYDIHIIRTSIAPV